MAREPLKHYLWSAKEDPKFREFFFVVTGFDITPVYNRRKTLFMYSTDRLREVERHALRLSNYKSLRILDEKPKNWQNHPENDIIGCVDYADQLPEPVKYKDRILRVEVQRKRFALKNRRGLYKSDGVEWKRVGNLPKGFLKRYDTKKTSNPNQ